MKIREHKQDIWLICIAILVGIIILSIYLLHSRPGNLVVVKLDNEVIASYPLCEDRVEVIRIDEVEYNTLTISGGCAYMSEASCPDGLCMNMGKISNVGQSVVCLPHKLVVSIEGEQLGQDIDAVSE